MRHKERKSQKVVQSQKCYERRKPLRRPALGKRETCREAVNTGIVMESMTESISKREKK